MTQIRQGSQRAQGVEPQGESGITDDEWSRQWPRLLSLMPGPTVDQPPTTTTTDHPADAGGSTATPGGNEAQDPATVTQPQPGAGLGLRLGTGDGEYDALTQGWLWRPSLFVVASQQPTTAPTTAHPPPAAAVAAIPAVPAGGGADSGALIPWQEPVAVVSPSDDHPVVELWQKYWNNTNTFTGALIRADPVAPPAAAVAAIPAVPAGGGADSRALLPWQEPVAVVSPSDDHNSVVELWQKYWNNTNTFTGALIRADPVAPPAAAVAAIPAVPPGGGADSGALLLWQEPVGVVSPTDDDNSVVELWQKYWNVNNTFTGALIRADRTTRAAVAVAQLLDAAPDASVPGLRIAGGGGGGPQGQQEQESGAGWLLEDDDDADSDDDDYEDLDDNEVDRMGSPNSPNTSAGEPTPPARHPEVAVDPGPSTSGRYRVLTQILPASAGTPATTTGGASTSTHREDGPTPMDIEMATPPRPPGAGASGSGASASPTPDPGPAPAPDDFVAQQVLTIMAACTRCIDAAVAASNSLKPAAQAGLAAGIFLSSTLTAHGASGRYDDPLFHEARQSLKRAVSRACTHIQEADARAAVGADLVMCRMCYLRVRDAQAWPCMDSAYCYDCLNAVHRQGDPCPFCRQPISSVRRYYLSANRGQRQAQSTTPQEGRNSSKQLRIKGG